MGREEAVSAPEIRQPNVDCAFIAPDATRTRLTIVHEYSPENAAGHSCKQPKDNVSV
jgi:hypothetical protein